jgi:SAM-dependent methyltransferase
VSSDWNPSLYQSSHAFVWEYGKELVGLLAPKAGERILDAGCGTGQLTAEIARAGAEVVGIDNSPAMIEKARGNFPDLQFEVAGVTGMPYCGEFDAVFSNAMLHWVRDADAAASAMARALKAGGRFVAEFGGHGNTKALLQAIYRSMEALGIAEPEKYNPWFYPTIGEYAGLLERHGIEVHFAALFDRPTALDGGARGLANWLGMFGAWLTAPVPDGRREEFQRLVEQHAAPQLWREGKWWVDYRRLRVMGRKTGGDGGTGVKESGAWDGKT